MPRWSGNSSVHGQDGVVFFHVPSGEERTKRVDTKTGKVCFPGSREQKEFRSGWKRAGGIYGVARSVEEGRALMEKWNVLTCTRDTNTESRVKLKLHAMAARVGSTPALRSLV